MRARPVVVVVLAAVWSGLAVTADEDAASTADRVRQLVRLGQTAGLAEIAATPEVDRWAVVDDLLCGGHAAAARAFAAACEGADVLALKRYAETQPPADDAVRRLLEGALDAVRRGAWEDALEALRAGARPESAVLAMRVATLEGRLLAELGRFDEARAPYARAAVLAHELGRDLDGEAEALGNRFGAVLATEDITGLARIAGRLVDVAQMRGDASLCVALANLGSIYAHLALPRRAVQLLDRGMHELSALAEEAQDDSQRAWARGLLPVVEFMRAQAYSALGRHAAALEAGERALAWYRSTEDRAGVSQALATLAEAHAAYGGFEESLRLNREALVLLDEESEASTIDRLRLRVNEGHALQELNELDGALAILDEAIPCLESLASGRGLAVALLNRGEIQEKRGAWDAALRDYERVSGIDDLGPWLTAFAQVRRGDALSMRGAAREASALEKADAAYRAGGERLPTEADPGLHLLAYLGRGEVALARGDARGALRHTRTAITLLEGLTGGLADGEALVARAQADRQRLFRLAARAAIASGLTEVEFEMFERSRARAFLAALGGRRAVQERLLTPQAQRRLEAAAERLTAAYAEQREALASGRLKEIRVAKTRLQVVQREHERTVRSLERSSQRLTDLLVPPLADLERARAALSPGDALVLYALVEPESHALVVYPGGARSVVLPSRAELVAACEALAVESTESAAEIRSRLGDLGATLLAALGLPTETNRLIVSPDGVLAHLPWGLLAEAARREPLDVVLVPSAATWLVLGERRARTGERKLALGDPLYVDVHDARSLRVYARGQPLPALPWTRQEVLAITRATDVRLLDRGATEAGLADALAQEKHWRVVHLAAHCVLDEADPAFSALALTPAAPNDGFLTALEISTLDVPTDLVVLSGCETGRDRTVTGEGLTGLARAFLLAGAARVLVSQWPVDDAATRHFMTTFHEEWAKPGAGIGTALDRARASTRDRWPHPRDWGGWVRWGRAD